MVCGRGKPISVHLLLAVVIVSVAVLPSCALRGSMRDSKSDLGEVLQSIQGQLRSLENQVDLASGSGASSSNAQKTAKAGKSSENCSVFPMEACLTQACFSICQAGATPNSEDAEMDRLKCTNYMTENCLKKRVVPDVKNGLGSKSLFSVPRTVVKEGSLTASSEAADVTPESQAPNSSPSGDLNFQAFKFSPGPSANTQTKKELKFEETGPAQPKDIDGVMAWVSSKSSTRTPQLNEAGRETSNAETALIADNVAHVLERLARKATDMGEVNAQEQSDLTAISQDLEEVKKEENSEDLGENPDENPATSNTGAFVN